MEKEGGNTIVYTAIFGGRDTLVDPKHINPSFKYVCFTDNKKIRSGIWDVRYYSPVFPDPVMSAKLFKILPQNFFSEFETSIWIDGNMIIAADLAPLLGSIDTKHTLACFDHKASSTDPVGCIYDEAAKLLQQIKEGKRPTLDPAPIEKQVKRLTAEGFPKQYGLISGNLLVRRHMDDVCIRMMEDWWLEILRGSRRDELSFNYLAWKNGFAFNYISGDFKNNELFVMLKHTA